MATLRVTFAAASPAPANGYLIRYRKAGSADPYSTVNTLTSPVDITVADGFSYEGTISSDCGGGVFSTSVSFAANVVAQPCYIYEFINNGSVNATVYYKECNSNTQLTLTVVPVSLGGTTLYQCLRSDSVFINSTQLAPGTNGGTVDNVTYARAIDAGCV